MPKRPKLKTVWRGPEEDGITQSLLSRFLVCRERFRLLVIHGIRPKPVFKQAIEYGNMWHVCEESYAQGKDYEEPLTSYCQGLCSRYRAQQDQVEHWYRVCLTQFPLYIDYWERNGGDEECISLMQEEVFRVLYPIVSSETGRTVWSVQLRGKWDGVLRRGKRGSVWLSENKTKGQIIEEQLRTQLGFDMQTMIYLIALRQARAEWSVWGVRYNVVRRPLSGGKGTIRQHKPTKTNPAGETKDEFYGRLAGVIMEEPGYYFMRWDSQVLEEDVAKFKREFLSPILGQLCQWWEWVSSYKGRKDPFANPIHWRTPFGFYNILAEGGHTDLDEYMATGSTFGLETADDLFSELS